MWKPEMDYTALPGSPRQSDTPPRCSDGSRFARSRNHKALRHHNRRRGSTHRSCTLPPRGRIFRSSLRRNRHAWNTGCFPPRSNCWDAPAHKQRRRNDGPTVPASVDCRSHPIRLRLTQSRSASVRPRNPSAWRPRRPGHSRSSTLRRRSLTHRPRSQSRRRTL
jgi:hypothetical protein